MTLLERETSWVFQAYLFVPGGEGRKQLEHERIAREIEGIMLGGSHTVFFPHSKGQHTLWMDGRSTTATTATLTRGRHKERAYALEAKRKERDHAPPMVFNTALVGEVHL